MQHAFLLFNWTSFSSVTIRRLVPSFNVIVGLESQCVKNRKHAVEIILFRIIILVVCVVFIIFISKSNKCRKWELFIFHFNM